MRKGTKTMWVDRRHGVTYISPRLYYWGTLVVCFAYASVIAFIF